MRFFLTSSSTLSTFIVYITFDSDTDVSIAPFGHTQRTLKDVVWWQNDTFAQEPSAITEKAWADLIPEGRGFVKHPKLAKELKSVSVFHEIHCLVCFVSLLSLPDVRSSHWLWTDEQHVMSRLLTVPARYSNCIFHVRLPLPQAQTRQISTRQFTGRPPCTCRRQIRLQRVLGRADQTPRARSRPGDRTCKALLRLSTPSADVRCGYESGGYEC